MEKNDRITFVLYCMGCMFSPLLLIVHFGVLDSALSAFFLLLLISVCIYLLWHYVKYKWICWLILAGGIAVVFMNQSILIDALMYAYNQVVETYRQYTGLSFQKFDIYFSRNQVQIEVLLLLSLMQIFVSEIMCFLFDRRKPFLIFIVSLLLVSPSLFFQIRLNWILMLLVFAFWFMLFVAFNDKKILIDWKSKRKTAFACRT